MKTPDRIERELLSAYREGERMPAALRTAAWARLQTALHADALHDALADNSADDSADRPAGDLAGDLAGRTADDSRPARHEPARRTRWSVLLLAAAAILVLIAGLRGRADRASEERDSQAVHASAEPPSQAPVPQAPDVRGTQPPAPAPTVAPASEPVEPVAPSPRAPSRAVDAGPDASSGLDAELSLLRAARAALAASDGAGALKQLGEHERRFRDGHLAEERMLLRVQALCAVDRREEARAAAARFAAQRPGSPHAATITAICRD